MLLRRCRISSVNSKNLGVESATLDILASKMPNNMGVFFGVSELGTFLGLLSIAIKRGTTLPSPFALRPSPFGAGRWFQSVEGLA